MGRYTSDDPDKQMRMYFTLPWGSPQEAKKARLMSSLISVKYAPDSHFIPGADSPRALDSLIRTFTRA